LQGQRSGWRLGDLTLLFSAVILLAMLDPFSRKTLVNLIVGAVLFAVLMLVDWIVRSLFGR
jgi:hypothetical protein